jgi:hypothetical protein
VTEPILRAASRKRAALADPKARKFLRNADPVLARLIDAPGLSSARLDGQTVVNCTNDECVDSERSAA